MAVQQARVSAHLLCVPHCTFVLGARTLPLHPALSSPLALCPSVSLVHPLPWCSVGKSCQVKVIAPVPSTPLTSSESAWPHWTLPTDACTWRSRRIVYDVQGWGKCLGHRRRNRPGVLPPRRVPPLLVRLHLLGAPLRPDVALALHREFRDARGMVELKPARMDRHRRHLLQASRVRLLHRAAHTMSRSRFQTLALSSVISRYVLFGSHVEMLLPSLFSLSTLGPCWIYKVKNLSCPVNINFVCSRCVRYV